MSKRSQEKRKARAKEKRLAKRRMMGSSPLSRLAGTAEETCECWMTASPDSRMVSLSVLRPVRGGQMVAAFFLIDYDCIGLKDAFYRLNVDAFELRELLRQRSLDDGVRMLRVEVSQIRQRVAGALRWTRQYPFFRVPADAGRCLKIIGGAGDIDAADIGDFGDENGDLYYVGRQIDLVKRLQGLTLEEFMDREDVECVFHMGDASFEDLDDEEADAWEEPLLEVEPFDIDEAERDEEKLLAMRDKVKHKMMDAIRKWCFANAVMPHPALESAVDLTLAASAEALSEEDEEQMAELARSAQETLASFESPEGQESIAGAMQQIKKFTDSFASREDYLAALEVDALDSL